MRPLLILRPEPGNAATLARARARGLRAHGIPLFAVEARPWLAPDAASYAGVLLTSANGVRHAGGALKNFLHLPAYAVGEATGDAARAAGFASVVVGERDVDRLIARVATLGPHKLLHLAGENSRPFDPLGIVIDRRVVYASTVIAAPDGLSVALEAGPVILLHSPRAAARLAELAGARAHITLAAISAATAHAAGQGWQEIALAIKPRDDALLALADSLCRRLDQGQ